MSACPYSTEALSKGETFVGGAPLELLRSHLARLELKVVFSGIIAHIRKPRLAGEISWLKSNFINGIRQMRIRCDVVKQD